MLPQHSTLLIATFPAMHAPTAQCCGRALVSGKPRVLASCEQQLTYKLSMVSCSSMAQDMSTSTLPTSVCVTDVHLQPHQGAAPEL
jgi:hypothetical protein